jgi:hypothetical protein
MTLANDGTCVVAYNYFGNLTLKLKKTEVSDEMAVRMVEEHDKHYHPKEEEKP